MPKVLIRLLLGICMATAFHAVANDELDLEAELEDAAAIGDVCEARPDLCDEDAPAKSKDKKKQAKKKAAPKCRAADDERDHMMELPVCGTLAAEAEAEIGREFFGQKSAPSRRSSASGSRSQAQRGLSFDSYVSSNARNPALSTRARVQQTAFQDVPRTTSTASASSPSPVTNSAATSNTSTSSTNTSTSRTPASTVSEPASFDSGTESSR